MLPSMTATEQTVMKLTLAGQLCVKNSYTKFHENLKNGLATDAK
jgi:hypothetical protein